MLFYTFDLDYRLFISTFVSVLLWLLPNFVADSNCSIIAHMAVQFLFYFFDVIWEQGGLLSANIKSIHLCLHWIIWALNCLWLVIHLSENFDWHTAQGWSKIPQLLLGEPLHYFSFVSYLCWYFWGRQVGYFAHSAWKNVSSAWSISCHIFICD